MAHTHYRILFHVVFSTKGRRELLTPEIRSHPKLAIADLVGKVKANSSKWMNEEAKWGSFAWQQGYSVFSVSYSQEEATRTYIANQEEHHRKVTFADELIAILEKHQTEYDPRFVVD